MKNVIVLGAGRSGTSMLAGTLSGSTYFMGNRLLPALESNPKGFFEDKRVNRINESLIARSQSGRRRLPTKWFRRAIPGRHQRWLSLVPLETNFTVSSSVSRKIRRLVRQEPFCFKDPRFCYTLPAWQPFLNNTVFICIFRAPAVAAWSMVKECERRPYLRNLNFSFSQGIAVWHLMYRHVLEHHCMAGRWLFLHYRQLFDPEGLGRIERFTGAVVDHSFPDAALERTRSTHLVSEEIAATYARLCELAGYSEDEQPNL